MSTYSTTFSGVADSNGEFRVSKSADLPIRVKISEIKIAVSGQCLDRQHSLSCSLVNGQDSWAGTLQYKDCSSSTLSINRKFDSGNWNIGLIVGDYNSGETVNGNIDVDYSISIFWRFNLFLKNLNSPFEKIQ